MRFLANENFPISSINYLKDHKFDVVAVVEKLKGASDLQVLEFAAHEKRIILTFDRDYGELIYRYKSLNCPGIIYLKFTPENPLHPAKYISNLVAADIDFTSKFTVAELNRIRQRNIEFLK